jgi:hypothetical protein
VRGGWNEEEQWVGSFDRVGELFVNGLKGESLWIGLRL